MNGNEWDLDSILSEFESEAASAPQPPRAAERPERVSAEPDVPELPAPQPEPAQARPAEKTAARVKPAAEKKKTAPRPAKAAPAKAKRRRERLHPFAALVFGLLFAACLAFGAVNLHPSISTSAGKATQRPAAVATPEPTEAPAVTPEPVVPAVEVTAEPTPSPEPTPEPAPEPIRYSIPEGTLVAPAPRAEGYGTVSNDEAYRMADVIQRARDYGLLGPEERTVFDPYASNFYRGSQAKDIQYYLDETILAILWKEEIDGNSVTLSEVKIADGSQLRRKFADDSFGAGTQYFASELARSTNAVVAMNADFYLFRDLGIVAYERELYRFNTGSNKYNAIDTLFVTSGGDFLYKRVGEENTWDSIQQFIRDNDVVFSVAFGPVLVENGQALECAAYPVGEINSGYSRAGIGQVDTLHYLYMSLNHSNEKQARWTVNRFAQEFAAKGVITAYCLDGGQTGEVVFRGEPYNYIDFNAERLVSDILYFATALPEEGGFAG